MRTLFFLCAILCMATTTASAQKITQKDLQGAWKMIAFSADGIHVDVPTEKITLSPELESQLTPDMKQEIELGILEAMESLKTSFAYFEGNNVRQAMGTEEQKGTYTLKDIEGQQLLTATLADGTMQELGISIKGNTLYLMHLAPDAGEFIYVKQ